MEEGEGELIHKSHWYLCFSRFFFLNILYIVYTVKLGYNELGYNEHPDITNKLNSFGWFELFQGYIFPVITNRTRL